MPLDLAEADRLLGLAAGNPLAIELIGDLLQAGHLPGFNATGAGNPALPDLIEFMVGTLPLDAQRLFERLCVSAAGFEANLVQSLADSEPRIHGEIARLVAAMTQLGLIRTQTTEILAPRFEIPAATREIGLARLSASGELAHVRLAYSAHMLQRAAGVRDLLAGVRRNAALAWFEREYPGLRLAFGAFVQLNRVQHARDMAVALLPYWLLRRRFREARRWLTVALELTGPPYSDDIEQELLVALGLIELYSGNRAAARARSLAGARPGMPVPQTSWRAAALATLGMLAAQEGEFERAIGLYRVFLEASRSARDGAAWTPQLRTLTRLASTVAYLARGELDEAEFHATMALKRALALGDPLLVGYARVNLAAVAVAKRDLETALELYRDGIMLLLEQPHTGAASAGILGLARLALQMKAVALSDRLIELTRFLLDAGSPIPPYLVTFEPDEGASERSQLTDPVANLADAAGIVARGIEELAAAQAYPHPPSAREVKGGLSNRELEVLCLAARDMTDLEIADALFISKRTSSDHMRNVIGKLGVNSRTGAVARALREGWCS
jgi:DNA-binding CsgD family transcriptional regulator